MGYSLSGIGMARPAILHQRIARNIVINYYLQTGFASFEAFQEGNASFSDPDSLIPDVVFYAHDSPTPLVAVEIERTALIAYRLPAKISEYLNVYGLSEVFSLDYEKGIWTRHSRSPKGIKSKQTSFSEVLQTDLAELTVLGPSDGLAGLFS